jgi:tRNA pseudouridine55 synthase
LITNFNGVLPVYKPRTMISKDVSRFLTNKLGKVKLGHLGTLDPMAEGLLPILMGTATKLQDQLLQLPKKYLFEVTFGFETDTLDADGQEVKRVSAEHLTHELLANGLAKFRGKITQLPPAYSAAKFKGRPLYEYVRKDKMDLVPLADLARQVEILSFELLDFADGKANFAVECSKGTYVRVLAKDLSESLGTCGTVTKIIRSACGGIELSDALTLEQVTAQIDNFANLLIPINKLRLPFRNWQSIEPVWTRKLQRGQKLLVRNDHFVKCLQNNSRPGESQVEGHFFLMDEHGVAFGIGSARLAQDGCVQMSMTRGLQ